VLSHDICCVFYQNPTELSLTDETCSFFQVEKRLVDTHPQVDSQLIRFHKDNIVALGCVEQSHSQGVQDLLELPSYKLEHPDLVKSLNLGDLNFE